MAAILRRTPPTSSSSSRRFTAPGAQLPGSDGFPLRLPGCLLLSPDPEHRHRALRLDPLAEPAGLYRLDQLQRRVRLKSLCCYLQNSSTTTRSTWATTCRYPGTPTILNVPMTRPGGAFRPGARPSRRTGPTPPWQLNLNQAQPTGLTPRSTATLPVTNDANLLPPMRRAQSLHGRFFVHSPQTRSLLRWLGAASSFWAGTAVAIDPLWSQSWEDDLIMTGVRSFDIKAYDNSRATTSTWGGATIAADHRRGHCRILEPDSHSPGLHLERPVVYDTLNQTFAHEGRMPPLVEDQRFDAQFAARLRTYRLTAPYAAQRPTTGNIGDDQPGIVRLRRVWDSWSTDYSRAPGTGVYLNKGNTADPLQRLPLGSPVLAADLSVVSAALPGAPAGHPDPDPGHGPDQSAYQDIDDPSGFHGQAVR